MFTFVTITILLNEAVLPSIKILYPDYKIDLFTYRNVNLTKFTEGILLEVSSEYVYVLSA